MNLMVVDDERAIRCGLIETIEWVQYGIEKILGAENALSALDKIITDQVDIIIADIRMAGMNGLEMAERAKELKPDIKIILLTGYAEFEYARKAIKLGVDEYFLKPVKISELVETVSRLSSKILEERKRNEIIKGCNATWVGDRENSNITNLSGEDIKYELEQNTTSIKSDDNIQSEKSRWFIEKCKQYIERNFSNNISLEELSAHVGRNPSYISHVFKQVEGRSFSDFINLVRIKKAMELLERSSIHIYEVAGNVGFSDYRHFIHVFKKITGVIPSEYKNKRF